MQQVLDWCFIEEELVSKHWADLKVKDRPEVHPHGVLSDDPVHILLRAKDAVLHNLLLVLSVNWSALWGSLWANS